MPLGRRDFLKMAGAGLATIAAPLQTVSAAAEGDPAAMLYDATICVGCRACQVACKRRSKLRHETDSSGLYEAPTDLTAYTWTLIKQYNGKEGDSFVKNQCMHCNDPACVSVCPVAALEKTKEGPVVYHAERCIGCRYCMAACPFGIPKTQWDVRLPLIQKCDFCADLQAKGEHPACGVACPTGALIYGKRSEMLQIAHKRLENGNRYYQHVYGEKEVGGTSMLYLASVSFTALGFPELGEKDLPSIDWPYMKAVPAVVAVMVSLSSGVYWWTHRREKAGQSSGKKEA